MKAMIFAAGLGTRLRPLTSDKPKALVEINGVTLLERVIVNLRNAGFCDIVVNVHHFADLIIDFLRRNHNFGINIVISDERDLLLDTGGGVLNARPFLDGNEPFLLHNVDILSTVNLEQMYNQHIRSGALASLLVKDRVTSRYFLFNDSSRLCGWTNVKTGDVLPAGIDADAFRRLAFGGIHVISPEIFPLLKKYANDEKVFSLVPFYIGNCSRTHIIAYEPAYDYKWIDVGKLNAVEEAKSLF